MGIIEKIIIIALVIRGIKIVTELLSLHWLGKDFEDLENWAFKGTQKQKKIRTTILKPLILCNICMSSIHGTWIYWVLTYPEIDIINWPICIVGAAGLNQVINEI